MLTMHWILDDKGQLQVTWDRPASTAIAEGLGARGLLHRMRRTARPRAAKAGSARSLIRRVAY